MSLTSLKMSFILVSIFASFANAGDSECKDMKKTTNHECNANSCGMWGSNMHCKFSSGAISWNYCHCDNGYGTTDGQKCVPCEEDYRPCKDFTDFHDRITQHVCEANAVACRAGSNQVCRTNTKSTTWADTFGVDRCFCKKGYITTDRDVCVPCSGEDPGVPGVHTDSPGTDDSSADRENSVAGDLGTDMKKVAGDVGTDMVDDLESGADTAGNGIKAAASTVKNYVENGATDMADAAGDWFWENLAENGVGDEDESHVNWPDSPDWNTDDANELDPSSLASFEYTSRASGDAPSGDDSSMLQSEAAVRMNDHVMKLFAFIGACAIIIHVVDCARKSVSPIHEFSPIEDEI